LPLQVDAVTKRIHTDYMQTVAATGRLSSTNPICKTSLFTERGQKNQKSIYARDENYYNLCRLPQIELRISCWWKGKHDKSFLNNEDIKSTAKSI
jgi:DNA polymerase-1